jgi:hypothetical protein
LASKYRDIIEQNRDCGICHKKFMDYNEVVPDHKDPQGGRVWMDEDLEKSEQFGFQSVARDGLRNQKSQPGSRS